MSYSDMITVETAIGRVLSNTSSLDIVSLPLTVKLLGHRLAEDIVADADFPPFRASIMDGYAVNAPLEPGVYKIQESILAGATPNDNLKSGEVAYITTGAMVPDGANAVIKVEDTELVTGGVNIKVPVSVGTNIRAIGSDIANGEVVLSKGVYIGPTELGLLVTVGATAVRCFRRPKIGVLSTGNELVDSHETPTGSKIRDSNRVSLISSFLEEGHDVIDLGIVTDTKEVLREKLLQAAAECDVVVTSGGVSMGNADFVRPLLNELGKIHFCKLNMKPGKPTTFASYSSTLPDGRTKSTLFFGLPGNPVSCLVTKALFVDPALKRLQGTAAADCLHPQLQVRLEGGNIALDPERAEYHRAILRADSSTGVVYASSTGNQRSSRLLSMRSSNALLFLPRGPGEIKAGSSVTALVIRPLNPPAVSCSVHPSAAALDLPAGTVTAATTAAAGAAAGGDKDAWKVIRTGLLTISDRASQGVYTDESGPEMRKLLTAMSDSPDWPLAINITSTAVVPDDPAMIQQVIEQWTDPKSALRVDFILASGGTGFGLRDNTPEVIKPLLHREAPGVAQALLNEGLKFTPLAVLSRPVVGTRYTTFIATLPGSVKAIRENITCLKALLPRIFELLKCNECTDAPKA